jgi:hypothetical protein
MEKNEKNLFSGVYNQLKNEYKDITEIIMEDEVILIYADDEILWKIFEDKMDEYRSIEFEAEKNESHFIRIHLQ